MDEARGDAWLDDCGGEDCEVTCGEAGGGEDWDAV